MAGTRGSVGRKRELSRPRGLLGGDARSLVQKLFWWQAKISFSGRPGSPRSRTANRSLTAARLILFVLAAAVVLSVTLISAASVALADGPSVGVNLTPLTASITAGGSEVYQATPYLKESDGNSYGSVRLTSITITIADGTCTPTATPGSYSCGATTAGTHPVTATVIYTYQVNGYTTGDTATGTATATVPLDVQHGPPVSLALNPSSGSIIAGQNSQPYQAIGTDAQGNSFDATGSTDFTIAPDGSCNPDTKTCSATKAVPHTVTGTYNLGDGATVTGTASLDVQHGPPVSLTLNPSSGSVIAGENSQPYQAIGTDAYGNTFDATDSTGFTITPDGSCNPDTRTCSATKATPHTVTGTYDLGNGATVTGTASLTVVP